MQQPLDETDVRVLGALIEKEVTTPDSYGGARAYCSAPPACLLARFPRGVWARDDNGVVFATLIGIAFPIVLMIYLRFSSSRGSASAALA